MANGSGDVVSLLLSAQDEATGERMSDSQLRDEVVTLLLASHETTANALAWTWYLLARHPDAAMPPARRDRRCASGQAAFHSAGDVPDLPFTRMVLAESMRLYPPAWLLARVAVEDHEARGYVIPRGSLVVLSPWVVHRSRTYFLDPERFDPERWRAERHNGRPRFSYFPVWRRIARMHGRGIRVDGRSAARRHHRPAVALSTARRIVASGNASRFDADAEVRDSREGRAADRKELSLVRPETHA